ncbi:zinc ribbon domain-containing protein [Acetivibrio clariflavus]|uniref:zinc ribbon domain-containing protein n=1 Tax=Acetivibrio clariflavus TaxID=288965 RepID=UPI0031F4E7E4
MSFFEKLTSAGKDMAKKTKELADITKLNMQISSEEDKIKNKYLEIGKLYYELFSSNPDEKFAEFCAAITESKNKIALLKDQILEIKGAKKCSYCGAEIAKSAVFCSACGNKVANDENTTSDNTEESSETGENTESSQNNNGFEVVVNNYPSENTNDPQQVDSTPTLCPSCNNAVPSDSKFCPDCGNKLE